jgi:hypothetical protein
LPATTPSRFPFNARTLSLVQLARGLGMRMPHLSSTILFWIIAVAGFIAVMANTAYPEAKEAEKKAALAANAVAIINPELNSNWDRFDQDNSALKLGYTGNSMDYFDVSAWETISKRGLLLGLDVDYVNKMLKIYNLMYRANSVIGVIIEHTNGTSSSLSNSADTVIIYKQRLSDLLEKIGTAYKELGFK